MKTVISEFILLSIFILRGMTKKFNHGDLTYVFVDDESTSDEEYSRVFAVTIDGREYELIFERRNRNGMDKR